MTLAAVSLGMAASAQNRWTIEPDGKTIGVRTFSPLFAISYISSDQAWRTAPYDQFEFVIDKP